jgi:CRISPR-associated endoribonuclease Cas6
LTAIETNVMISRYALRTERVDFGSFGETGWMGVCRYEVFSEEVALKRVLHLLSDFAFYCGTGYKTPQGMGQTRKLGARRSEPRPPEYQLVRETSVPGEVADTQKL